MVVFKKITPTIIDDRFLKLELQIDTKEAMGANIVNTICEAIAHAVQEQLGGNLLLSVLTNAAFESVVTASVTIDPATLTTATLAGETIAEKMIAASDFAKVDVARAATHNKGIMNGIDAVVLATGNDWRAIEAACIVMLLERVLTNRFRVGNGQLISNYAVESNYHCQLGWLADRLVFYQPCRLISAC